MAGKRHDTPRALIGSPAFDWSDQCWAPGSSADRHELERLARTAARHDGFYATHLRDEGAGVQEAVAEAVAIGEGAGASVHLSHLKSTSWLPGIVRDVLGAIEAARARGVAVSADQYPYTMSSTKLGAVLSMAEPEPDKVLIAHDPSGRYAGMTLAQLAVGLGGSLADALASLPASVRDSAQVLLLDRMREEDVRDILADASVAVASDGWTLASDVADGNPHPRNFGTFARVLGHYCRDVGLLPLPAAIRKMTSVPAGLLRMPDRGRIVPGAIADLVVLDPDRVTERATIDDPFVLATGMRHVIVAGVPVIDDGAMTDARPGRALRRLAGGWSA